ncbi:RNA polymerase sigma factor [Engelhardtia mirabilis]|uniref:RNA polymerase sigma factor n=1 Tax=Engelhardtia mirabilis TaxID=2528011 RepID=A0A518BGT5_9BACT|nr:hypothetical protein Pla133_12510 [Planctomycetes bacterium Pla133]QDV00512.1 hypothetical protein Pla86_12510 [Planctomycetes bacterium Pla86]
MERETCWTLIEAAGDGDGRAREDFAALYLPAIRAYLLARWGSSALVEEVDDAQQEVFVECLKDGGVLERVQRGAASGFRGYLYGVVRNVAQRVEERGRRRADRLERGTFHAEFQPDDERSLSQAFDRAFAIGVLRAALRLHQEAARAHGGRQAARFELLRQRFGEGKSIAVIAEQGGQDAAFLHHEYATARREFHRHLLQIVGSQHPGATAAQIELESERLVELIDE